MFDIGVGEHDFLDRAPDLREFNFSGEKFFDGDFVGGIENRGEGSPFFSREAGKIQGGETDGIRGLKGEGTDLFKTELAKSIRKSIREGDGILDGETHVGVTELCQLGAIFEFDKGVDDALRMDNDIDLLDWDIEEPSGLDHFESFIEERGGVDGDLLTHCPSGVFEGLFEGDVFDIRGGGGAEGAAGGGEDESFDRIVLIPLETLENGVVLAIDRKNFDPFAFSGIHDGLSGHDEDLFTGNGEIFSRLNRGERGSKSSGSDDGNENHISLRHRGELDESLFATVARDIGGDLSFEIGNESGVKAGDRFRFPGMRLFCEEFRLTIRSKSDDLHSLGDIKSDLEGAESDGASGTEDHESFAFHSPSLLKSFAKWSTFFIEEISLVSVFERFMLEG